MKSGKVRYKLFVPQVQGFCTRSTTPLYQKYKPFVLVVRDYRNNRKGLLEQPQGTILINVRDDRVDMPAFGSNIPQIDMLDANFEGDLFGGLEGMDGG